MKRILITGGAGFIGSNFIRYLLENDLSDISIVNLDLLTYAGNLDNLLDVRDNPHYQFVQGDVCDSALVDRLFERYAFDTIVHFAAESHVDRSITNPQIFVTTNVLGTQVMLDAALRYWRLDPNDKYCRQFKEDVSFLQISTDEVYGALGSTGMFTESTPLSPNSPYSASKAGADLLVKAYYTTFGLPVNITRCSNNYGPYQFPEKLIPLMINSCRQGKPLPIYGDGMQVRDWLYVQDHCSAIDAVLHRGVPGEIYNIGGNNEKANIDIVRLIIKAFGKDENIIQHVADRLGHDRRYAIDNTKITTQLGWKPAYTFERGIEKTIQWYSDNQRWMEHVSASIP